jgi:hypothetical protein
MKRNVRPECFGCQAEGMLYGEEPDDCVECEWFDRCHKITVSASLLAIENALDLIVENGLSDGRLKGFEELEKIAEAAKGRK